MLQGKKIKRILKRWRRRWFELWGSDRYSKPAKSNLEKQLEKYLPNRGFFIEFGANDGFSESNTYYLERWKNWTGILIEPIPELYRECLLERPNSQVFNFALVSDDYPQTHVKMSYGHLMSLVKDSFQYPHVEAGHLTKAQEFFGVTPYEVEVPARTLTSILKELKVTEIDFFSLDVEGYELNVLKGLDLNIYRPKYLLIEFLNDQIKKEIEDYLQDRYAFVKQLGKYDYLYQAKIN